MIRFISAGRREKVATPQLCNVATERGTRRLTTILPLYEYHSRLHILPHLRDKIKDAEQDDIENTSSPLQAPPSDLLLHEHYEALSFIAAQDHETEPWSFDSLYDHRQPTPPLIGSIRIRMRYAYQHPRIDQQDVDHWMPTLPDSASFLSIDPDDDDASSIMSDASEAESEVGSVYSELELADGDYREREARSWDSDTSAGDNGSATTLVNEPPRRVEDLVRSDSAVQLEFETKLNEALDKSPRGRRERHPLDTADPGRPLHGGNADSRPSSRPSSRGGSRSVSPASKGGIDNGSQVSLTGSVLSRSISTASGRSPPHREGSISPSVIDLLQYGFSRRDADTRSVAGESVHSSSTDMSIRSGVFADKDFAKRWMMDSFEEVVMANPTMDWMIGMVVSPETRTLLRAVSKNTSLVTLASGSIGPRLQGQLHAADDRHHGTGEVLCGTAKGTAKTPGNQPRARRASEPLFQACRDRLHVIRLRSNRNAIIRFLRIPPEDLLGYEYGIRKGAAFHPSYFVALDSPQAAVVLGIRGTWSFYDAITDLVCEYRPWKDGLAHSGMLASAQWFFTHIIPQIFNYVHNSPVTLNSLIITGHSLGAGTAAILTMMVVDHLEELRWLSRNPDFTVHSYGFGPVAATSYELGQRYKDYIDAFVTQDDLVGRMSYGTAMQLKEMIVGTINAVEDVGGASKVGLVDPGGGRWKEVSCIWGTF
ncbi:hypothetical protein BC938DRAFT_474208 [Jimgerdemannia flammicorona]|uniref:sn-1-specific diacylglycerol lipase n=1 Tax=Jimgerdemannia flammicorona TaxID=994334 RepID=A0A433Q2K4_9FUNG|nr:hypothetical protein BC938DRAFT_474208 [Jimgerdemannia flammicorona]